MLEAECFGKPPRKGHAGRSCTGGQHLLCFWRMTWQRGTAPRLREPSSTISAHCAICFHSSSEPRGDRGLAGNSLLQSHHRHRWSSLVGLLMFSRTSSRGVVCKDHQCPEDRMTLAISPHLLQVTATILLGPCVWPLQMVRWHLESSAWIPSPTSTLKVKQG